LIVANENENENENESNVDQGGRAMVVARSGTVG
jgi:hypothetical protein